MQLDRSLTGSAEGVGLRLAVSRDVARGMHRNSPLLTAMNKGACFVLVLPSAPIEGSGA